MSGPNSGGWWLFALTFGLFLSGTVYGADYLGTDSCLECHEEYSATLKRNPHGSFDGATGLLAEQGCEACHGPGSDHVFQEGEPGTIASLAPGSDDAVNIDGACLQCHQTGVNQHWQGGAHDAAAVACTGCHRVHQPDEVRRRDGEAEVCYQCHLDIRAKAYRPYGHPLKEHKVVCSQCHNPHGGVGPHSLDAFTVNDNCYTCHAEKRGPFLFEHFPVAEDCTLCHDVHGSIHRGALTRTQPFLCIECHQEQAGGNHVRQVYDFATGNELVARGVLGRSCLNCHSQVHGTNHPSGVALMR
jgi:DmsE family decaheme c-type cytochrome